MNSSLDTGFREEPQEKLGSTDIAAAANNAISPQGRRPLMLHLVIALCAMAGAGFMLLRFLHWNGLWVDELYTLHAIRLPFLDMISERLKRGHVPLYFLTLRGWVAVLGAPSEAVLRLPSMVFWLLSVLSFWPMAKRFLTPRTALIALTLIALNGVALRQASEARMYTLVLLFAVWTTRAYCEIVAGTRARGRWTFVLVVATVLGWLTAPAFALLSAGLLYDGWKRRRVAREPLNAVLLAVGLAFVAILPALLLHMSTRDRNEVAKRNGWSIIQHLVALLAGVFADDDYFATGKLLKGAQHVAELLTIPLLIWIWRSRKSFSPLQQVWFRVVAFPLSIVTISWALAPLGKLAGVTISLLGPTRYLIALLPSALLLASDALASQRPFRSSRSGLVSHGLLATLLLCGAYGILTVRTEPFREYARRLANEAKPGDGIVLVPQEAREGFQLYVPGLNVDAAVDRRASETELVDAFGRLSDRKAILLLWYRGGESQAPLIGTRIWGPYVSSSNKDRLGILRILTFAPHAR